jgi:hypothetical protein
VVEVQSEGGGLPPVIVVRPWRMTPPPSPQAERARRQAARGACRLEDHAVATPPFHIKS